MGSDLLQWGADFNHATGSRPLGRQLGALQLDLIGMQLDPAAAAIGRLGDHLTRKIDRSAGSGRNRQPAVIPVVEQPLALQPVVGVNPGGREQHGRGHDAAAAQHADAVGVGQDELGA